jgi:protein-S-isoprenylcysteine O-methyltransferase Ste14
LVTAFQAGLLFLSAGRIDWLWAWVFVGLYLAGMVCNAVVLLRYNPETIAERAKAEGMQGWDRVVGGSFAVTYFAVTPLVAGLDQRFGWSAQTLLVLHLVGTIAFVLGFALIIWSMASNAFFVTVARIQEDRGQRVCTIGPYRIVRHPGYLGAVVHSLTVPLILGSWYALIPGGLAAMLMVARTALEDRLLKGELEGYDDYAQQVGYRLIPGVW